MIAGQILARRAGGCWSDPRPVFFRAHLLEALPADDLCRHLDSRLGRPSKDLHIVVGVLLLQQLHDMTDAQTVEALAFNMARHYALDVRGDADSYFCEKTLRNYHRLFIEQDFDEVLFRHLTDRLLRAFAVDTSRQRMDSTALRSAMRTLTRLGIVAQTISKFVREVDRYHPARWDLRCNGGGRQFAKEAAVIFGTIPPRIYVATRPVDFRKDLDGFVAVAQEVLKLHPFSAAAFIFRAKRGVEMLVWFQQAKSDRVKILISTAPA